MAWEENSCISLNMQLIAILSRIGVFNTFTLQIYDILFTLSPFADKISSFQTDHRPATRLLKILHADECHCFKPKRPNERLGGYWGMAEIFVPASLVIAIYFLHL